jgi:hypothetical protein
MSNCEEDLNIVVRAVYLWEHYLKNYISEKINKKTSCYDYQVTATVWNLLIHQSSSKVAFDVGVHDRLEMLKLAVIQETEDTDLQDK